MLAPLPAPRPAQSLVRRQITLLQERSACNAWPSAGFLGRRSPGFSHDVAQRVPLKTIQPTNATPSLPAKRVKNPPTDLDLKTLRMKSSYALYQCIEEDRLDVYDVPPPAKVLSEPSTPAKSNILNRHPQIARSLSSLLEAGQIKNELSISTLPRKILCEAESVKTRCETKRVVEIQCETKKIEVAATLRSERKSPLRSECETKKVDVARTLPRPVQRGITSTIQCETKLARAPPREILCETKTESVCKTTQFLSETVVAHNSESKGHGEAFVSHRTEAVGQIFVVQSSECKPRTETVGHAQVEEARPSPQREPRRHQLWRRFSSFNPCTRWEDWSGTSHKNHAKKCMEDKRAATLPTALSSPPSTSPLPPPASNRPLPPTPALNTSPASSSSPHSSGANLATALTSRPWFHDIDRRRAEELVRNGVDGYFLVRPSSQSANALTLTMWYNKRVYNISIRLRPDGRIALGTSKPNEQSFATVDEMVANYQSENLVLFSGGKRTGLTVLTTYPPHKN